MDAPKREKYHRVSAVAKFFDLSESWVYHLIETGQLKAVRFGKKKGLRVGDQAIDTYEDRRKNETGAE